MGMNITQSHLTLTVQRGDTLLKKLKNTVEHTVKVLSTILRGVRNMKELKEFSALTEAKFKVANVLWDSHLQKVKEQHQQGIWSNEPDYLQWFMPQENIVCVMWRHSSLGFWCGYLGLPRAVAGELPFHGGVTYRESTLGVYRPQVGEPEIEEWVGFDCGHCFDLSPFVDYSDAVSSYKDLGYVVQNLTKTALFVAEHYIKMK
jgi:hypothetical protein